MRKRIQVFLLSVCLAVFGVGVFSVPAQAAPGNILPPFDTGQTSWNICQGYNNPAVTHTGTSKYGLDLTGGGCDNTAAGRTVRAPVGGTVHYYQPAYGNLCINTAGGRSLTLTHINSSVTSGTLTAGQVVGTVAAAGQRGNNGVAHIHMQMWATPNCYSSEGIPFDSAHGTRICGAPDLTANGPSGGNGTWSGTSFTGQACDGTTVPTGDGSRNRSDVDSNGGVDLVLTTAEPSGGIAANILLSTYEQFLAPQKWWEGPQFGWEGVTPLSGDVNGDKKADYVFLTNESNGTKAFVAKSTGSGFQAPQLWWDGVGWGYSGIKASLGDVDGNGGVDLVLTTAEPSGGTGANILLSTYEQFLAPQKWWDGSSSGWEGVNALSGDVNGDKKADYIFLTNEPSGTKAFVAKSTGSGFQTPQLWWNGIGWGYNGIRPSLGDVDGNGGVDLVLTTAEPSGGIAANILLSTYEQFLAPQKWWEGPLFGWEGVKSMSGDINGDKKADYVFITNEPTGTKAFVAKSTGSGFQAAQLWWNGIGWGYNGIRPSLG